MGKEFNTTPQEVPHVSTKYRTICTPIPHPDSLSVLERSRKFEPISMSGMPPIVWEKAEDIFVYDKHGNRWLDWSSGVLVTNCGHGVPEVRQAIIDQVNSGLLHNYVFPGEERVDLAELIALVRERAPGRQILMFNSVAATDKEDILSYDAYDPPLSLALRNVRAREINAMLHDLAVETGIAIVDADAIAAELGVNRSIPDGTHQSGEMQQVLREEILSILRARRVPGFGGAVPPG